MGGAACGDNQGIGNGPMESMFCEDEAWYLYYWQPDDVVSMTSHISGWMDMPPGTDQGDYTGVTVQVELQPPYEPWKQRQRLKKLTIKPGRYQGLPWCPQSGRIQLQRHTGVPTRGNSPSNRRRQPITQGAAWEGTFTILVCDVSSGVNSTKNIILQPYGHGRRAAWCGPICEGD